MEEQPVKSQLYNPLPTVIISLFIFFAAQIGAGLLISVYPVTKHWTNVQANTWLQGSVWAQFLFVAIAEALTLGILYQFLKRRRLSFRDLGLNRLQAKYLAYALIGFVAYIGLYFIGLIVAKALIPSLDFNKKQDLGFDTNTTGGSLWPIFISLVILPPITEEILARGFLYGGLKTKLPVITAVLITSALFASAHLFESGGKGLLWVAGIDTFILSLVLCYVREKTGSLWPGIGIHMLKNGLAFIVLFNISLHIR